MTNKSVHFIGFLCAVTAFVIAAVVGNVVLGWSSVAFSALAVCAFVGVRQLFVMLGGNPSPRASE
jgi:hypothetical protein